MLYLQADSSIILLPMYKICYNRPKRQRRMVPLPSSIGKKHYWNLRQGDYGFYQSETKEMLFNKQADKLRHENMQSNTDSSPQRQKIYSDIQQYRRECLDRQVKRKCTSQMQNPMQDDLQRSLQHQDSHTNRRKMNPQEQYQHNPYYHNVDELQRKESIRLPKIKSSVEKEAQTSDYLLQLHPMFKKSKKQFEETQQSIRNENAKHIRKKSINPPIKKQQQMQEQRRRKLMRRYSPTFASSSGNTMHQYFNEQDEEYQQWKQKRRLNTEQLNRAV